MTRFLSESLEAHEPFFRLGLRRLEAAHGNPNTDIRFSNEVLHASRAKLPGLGLDPRDTAPEELYHALQERVKADDARLIKALRTRAATHISAEGDVVAGMVHALMEIPDSKRCYALKSSSFKALIKKLPPKKAMKQLGYRSLSSFLKHENPVAIFTASRLCEDERWQQRFTQQYKQLKPSDFESRQITIEQANFKRWQNLADTVVAHKKHNLLGFKELGAIVLLPLPVSVPSGTVTASLCLALHELNELRASSTFLKLAQVRADFGTVVQQVVSGEAQLSSQLFDRAMPWHLIQRFYAKAVHHFNEELFEPHIQLQDLAWHPIEQSLATIESSLSFWRDSAHLGVLDHKSKPVTFNIIDSALNACNNLPFERRTVQYFQHALRHEILFRYLKPAIVEKTVMRELQPQLATELALA